MTDIKPRIDESGVPWLAEIVRESSDAAKLMHAGKPDQVRLIYEDLKDRARLAAENSEMRELWTTGEEYRDGVGYIVVQFCSEDEAESERIKAYIRTLLEKDGE